MSHYTSDVLLMEVDDQEIKQKHAEYPSNRYDGIKQEYVHKRFNFQARGIQPTSPTTDPVSNWLIHTAYKTASEQTVIQERYWDNISEVSETPSEAGSTVPTPMVSPEVEDMESNNVGTWGQPIAIQDHYIEHHNQEVDEDHPTATNQFFPDVQHIKTEIVGMSPEMSGSEDNFHPLQMQHTDFGSLETEMLRTTWVQLVNEQTPPTPPESPNDILQLTALKPDHFTFGTTYPSVTDPFLDNLPQPFPIKSEHLDNTQQPSSSLGTKPAWLARKANKSRSMFNKRHGHLGGPFYCDECDRYFLKQNGFTQHMDVYHMGPRPYVCGQCGKSFREQDRLEKHEKCHDEQSKPFRCSECPKGFQHLQALERHFGLHHSNPSIWCEVCGKGFVRNDHLVSHLVSHDRNTVKPRKNKQIVF